jgi:hypothetical protein
MGPTSFWVLLIVTSIARGSHAIRDGSRNPGPISFEWGYGAMVASMNGVGDGHGKESCHHARSW